MFKVSKLILALLCVFIMLSSSICQAQFLPPHNLIAFNTPKGKILFETSKFNSNFYQIAPFFVTQKSLSYCAIASAVMVLNALQVPPPITTKMAPYRIFNQDNFFTEAALKITTPYKIDCQGNTLPELGKLFRAHGLKVTIHHGRRTSLNQFRQDIKQVAQSRNRFLVVNFLRENIKEIGGGHFSPIVAYDMKSDRALLMDVSRYKYPPVWVTVPELYSAIQGIDSTSHLSRGYLIVSRTEALPKRR